MKSWEYGHHLQFFFKIYLKISKTSCRKFADLFRLCPPPVRYAPPKYRARVITCYICRNIERAFWGGGGGK